MSDVAQLRSRLHLIQLVAIVISPDLPRQDHAELRGLIEALCRHQDLDMQVCITGTRHELLTRLSPVGYQEWRAEYLIDES